MPLAINNSGQNNLIEVHSTVQDQSLLLNIRGDENRVTIEAGVKLKNVEFSIRGNGNVVHIGQRTGMRQRKPLIPRIDIRGDGHTIALGAKCYNSSVITAIGKGGAIIIGGGTTTSGGSIGIREGRTISIGEECMFSGGVWIADSDMHPIYDRDSGARLNPGADVVIGDHVWLGADVKVLKGLRIGAGCMIGAHSLVTGDIPDHCMAQGSPARVVRENIRWERSLDGTPSRMSARTIGAAKLGDD